MNEVSELLALNLLAGLGWALNGGGRLSLGQLLPETDVRSCFWKFKINKSYEIMLRIFFYIMQVFGYEKLIKETDVQSCFFEKLMNENNIEEKLLIKIDYGYEKLLRKTDVPGCFLVMKN